MATKTEGQIAAARYAAYQKVGGKMGFWEWRNAGMPARDKGIVPFRGFLGEGLSEVGNVIGQIVDPQKNQPNNPFWQPEPTAASPPTPSAIHPLDPAFKTWLQTIYSPGQIEQIEKDGITSGQGKVVWDYYQKHVGALPTGQISQLDPDFRAWLVKQYGEQTARRFDLADANDPQLKALRDFYNTSVAPTPVATTPSKLDLGFRAWLVKQYGEDVAAYYDQTDYRDTGLAELRNYYNTNVNPVKDPNAMTAYQQGILDLQRRQFDWQMQEDEREKWRQEHEARNKAWQLQYDLQREASESAIEKQKNELELIKGRAFPFGDEEGRRMQTARDMSGAFESARQSILGSLTSPADWIKRWEVQNAANPYTPQPKSRLEQDASELANTNTRINMFTQMASEAEKLVAQLSANPDYEGSAVLAQAKSDVANYSNAAAAERGNLPARQANLAYSQGQPQPEPSQPVGGGNAPAPSWLPMFAPGQRAGQAITRENVATPSAQQWAGTPWSVQQGLSGYLDWAGYRPMADVLGNMAQMLPNAPGGGARWSPYIGR